MLLPVILSLTLTFGNIFIHGLGTVWCVRYLSFKKNKEIKQIKLKSALFNLSFTAIFLMLLHFFEVTLWAVVYMLIPDVHQLGTFEEAIYFSMTTFTTLGYGDITLGDRWRIMSGFEAMNGIMLFGWSTALLFSVVQQIIERTRELPDIVKKSN